MAVIVGAGGVLGDVYSGLVMLDTSLQVAPGLAERWDITPDGKTYTFQSGQMVISDANGPESIAGIMGGLDSGVTAETRDILFESAFFNPATIMGKARNFGMHTDSSHRFERGVDPAFVEAVLACEDLIPGF